MSKLEHLQRLSVEGKNEELQTAMTQCSCKELRSFIGQLGVPVRSKDYAIYNNKAGYIDLLSQILTSKSEHKIRTVTSIKTRKTKNCNFRLVNVIFGENLTTTVDKMNAEPTQTALDSDQTENNSFWEKVKVQFTSGVVEYGIIVFQDNCFGGLDLETPVHHSSEKLWKMWRELCAAYTSAAARFERSGDPDAEFFTFCRNRVDVYYLRCWLNVKPHLLVSVNRKLPATEPSINSSMGTGVVSVDALEETTGKSWKRKSDVMKQGSNITEFVVSDDGLSRAEERMNLMKSIKDACKTLKTVREASLGDTVEKVVRDELAMYVKRLKSIHHMEEKTC